MVGHRPTVLPAEQVIPMLLRVRDHATGHRYTTASTVVEADPGRYDVLDLPATGDDGRPLPPDTSPETGDTATLAADPFEATEEAD